MELSRSGNRALCEFFEGAEMKGDYTNWWVPNENALLGMCRAAGFSRAEVVRGGGGRLRQVAAARQAGLSPLQVLRAGVRRLHEELGGVRRYRAIVHAWR